jgi:hypothetical protein
VQDSTLDKEQFVSTIDVTVHNPEFAIALAVEGFPARFVQDHDDGPSLVLSVEEEERLAVVAALLRMVRDNPRLAPDVFDVIAFLMCWEGHGR